MLLSTYQYSANVSPLLPTDLIFFYIYITSIKGKLIVVLNLFVTKRGTFMYCKVLI